MPWGFMSTCLQSYNHPSDCLLLLFSKFCSIHCWVLCSFKCDEHTSDNPHDDKLFFLYWIAVIVLQDLDGRNIRVMVAEDKPKQQF